MTKPKDWHGTAGNQYDRDKRTSDTGELSEVVDDRLARVNVVVDEWDARLNPLASQDGHASQGLPRRPQDLLRPIRVELRLLLLQRNELGVDRDERPSPWQLVEAERLVLDHRAIAVPAHTRQ